MSISDFLRDTADSAKRKLGELKDEYLTEENIERAQQREMRRIDGEFDRLSREVDETISGFDD